jgi:opacity protein-like surface antigen
MSKWIPLLALLAAHGMLVAQNSESAVGGIPKLSAGVEYSNFNPDYGCSSNAVFHCGNSQGGLLNGLGAFVDFNVRPKWGAEGEVRWLKFGGLGGESETNYLVGGRYRMADFGKFELWGKFLLGDGTFDGPKSTGLSESHLAYVPGATLEYRLSRRLSLRVDYEYQFLPSFGQTTSTGKHDNGLTPNGVSLGVTWHFGNH